MLFSEDTAVKHFLGFCPFDIEEEKDPPQFMGLKIMGHMYSGVFVQQRFIYWLNWKLSKGA